MKDLNGENIHMELGELNMYRKFCSTLYALIYIVNLESREVLWVNDNTSVRGQMAQNGQDYMVQVNTFAARVHDTPDFEDIVKQVIKKLRKNPDRRWAGLHRVKDNSGLHRWMVYTASTMTRDENEQALTATIVTFPVEDVFNTPKTLKEFQKYIQLHINAKERDKLTDRQRQILKYIASGFSRKEIAQKMEISIYTVDDHRKAMLKKLDCRSTSELIRIAQRLGLMIE